MRGRLHLLLVLVAVGVARAALADVYADGVIAYTPDYGGGAVPTDPKYVNPADALGAPDYVPDAGGSGGDFNGTGAVSLGHGGRLDVLFADNVLTNSGGAGVDLTIYERGVEEQFHVALRPANLATATALGALCVDTAPADVAPGDGYCYVGLFGPPAGSDLAQINVDAAFAPGVFAAGALRFDAVQLIDTMSQGASSGEQVGPDIDAIEANASADIICGDGLVEGSEGCDDGDLTAGDGCSAACAIESCWECSGEPSLCAPDDGLPQPLACEDGLFCTQSESCVGLACTGGSARDCDDDNVCTDDLCDETNDVCANTANTLPCDDGSSCSVGDTCSNTECVGTAVEATGCRTALGPTRLRIHNRVDDQLDAVIWKWPKGAATTLEEIGDPMGGSGSYEFCVFDGPPGGRRVRAVARAEQGQSCEGEPCWVPKGTTGFLFKDRYSTYGVRHLLLKSGALGKAKALVKGRGAPLFLSDDITMTLPVRAQLRDTATGMCWEAVYPTAIRNDAERFKAKF